MHPHSIGGSKLTHCLLIDAKQGDLKIWKSVQMPRSMIWVLSWLKARVFLAPFSAAWTEFQEATDCQIYDFHWLGSTGNQQWVSWIAFWDCSDIAGFVAIHLGQAQFCNFLAMWLPMVAERNLGFDNRIKVSLFKFYLYVSATRSHLRKEGRNLSSLLLEFCMAHRTLLVIPFAGSQGQPLIVASLSLVFFGIWFVWWLVRMCNPCTNTFSFCHVCAAFEKKNAVIFLNQTICNNFRWQQVCHLALVFFENWPLAIWTKWWIP